MVVIIPEWIALIHWNRSTSGLYTRGTLQAEGDSLTCLAVRPSVSTTAGAYVAVHLVATGRSVLTRVARTLVDV